MKTFCSLLAGACAMLGPVIALAELGPIMITPTRTEQTGPASSATVYLISEHDIKASGATTTSELLRGIPGIQIDDLFGNGTQVSVGARGFSSSASTIRCTCAK